MGRAIKSKNSKKNVKLCLTWVGVPPYSPLEFKESDGLAVTPRYEDIKYFNG